jgi:hypothetical protein
MAKERASESQWWAPFLWITVKPIVTLPLTILLLPIQYSNGPVPEALL